MVIKGREGADFITVSDRRVTPAMMRRHIADIIYGVYSLDRADVAIVEPLLKAHPWFKGLFEGGLSDVRVIVIDDQAALAMIRVPTHASDGRANLHQGGIGLGVDLQTGRVTRALWRGRPLTLHPDSQATLVGELVPHWPEIVALAEESSRAVPLNYLGVDLIVDEQRGPLVLEINVRPGLEIQNVTGVALRRRLKALLNHTSEVRS
jgi:alpha-L-glutamate ligase-like protein